MFDSQVDKSHNTTVGFAEYLILILLLPFTQEINHHYFLYDA